MIYDSKHHSPLYDSNPNPTMTARVRSVVGDRVGTAPA